MPRGDSRRDVYRAEYFRLIGLAVALGLTSVMLWQPLLGFALLIPAAVLLWRLGPRLADRLTDRRFRTGGGASAPVRRRAVAGIGLLVAAVWGVLGTWALVGLTAVGDWLVSGSPAWIGAGVMVLVVVQLPVLLALVLAGHRLRARSQV